MEHTLFGDKGVRPDDVLQGNIGNCGLMSAISAVAEVPGRIEKIFQMDELNEAGIYALNFRVFDMPVTMVVDDLLPVEKTKDGYKTFFSLIADDSSMWVPIMEKAFAKYYGNYAHLGGSNTMFNADVLLQGPYYKYGFGDKEVDDLWDVLVDLDSKNDVMQIGFRNNESEVGLVGLHAYSLLGVKQLSTGERLVKIRNPWGRYERYRGDWSDWHGGSSLWTD